jgi:hypothetical protein
MNEKQIGTRTLGKIKYALVEKSFVFFWNDEFSLNFWVWVEKMEVCEGHLKVYRH